MQSGWTSFRPLDKGTCKEWKKELIQWLWRKFHSSGLFSHLFSQSYILLWFAILAMWWEDEFLQTLIWALFESVKIVCSDDCYDLTLHSPSLRYNRKCLRRDHNLCLVVIDHVKRTSGVFNTSVRLLLHTSQETSHVPPNGVWWGQNHDSYHHCSRLKISHLKMLPIEEWEAWACDSLGESIIDQFGISFLPEHLQRWNICAHLVHQNNCYFCRNLLLYLWC